MSYPVLAPVSEGYPKVQGRLLTCYSPVRRSSTPKGLSARLACVKHAASVRPEPGSNSPLNSFDAHQTKAQRFIDSLEYPSKSAPQSGASYLKESSTDTRRTRPKPSPPATCRLALQINSSTFSTLLSSQGSSARHSPASQPSPRGNPTKLTGPTRPRQIRDPPELAPHHTTTPEPTQTHPKAQPDHLGRGAKKGIRPKPATRPTGLMPRHSGDKDNTSQR